MPQAGKLSERGPGSRSHRAAMLRLPTLASLYRGKNVGRWQLSKAVGKCREGSVVRSLHPLWRDCYQDELWLRPH